MIFQGSFIGIKKNTYEMVEVENHVLFLKALLITRSTHIGKWQVKAVNPTYTTPIDLYRQKSGTKPKIKSKLHNDKYQSSTLTLS